MGQNTVGVEVGVPSNTTVMSLGWGRTQWGLRLVYLQTQQICHLDGQNTVGVEVEVGVPSNTTVMSLGWGRTQWGLRLVYLQTQQSCHLDGAEHSGG